MYCVVTTYDDGFTKSEICREITNVFSVSAIYAQDPECVGIIAMDTETKEFVIDWTRRTATLPF